MRPYPNNHWSGVTCIHYLSTKQRKNDLLIIALAHRFLFSKQERLNPVQCGNSLVQPAAALVYLHGEVRNPICTSEHSGGFIINVGTFTLLAFP